MSSKPQQKPFKIGSSPPEVFYSKEILKNFVKFIGKHLCWSLLFHKVTSSEAVTWRCSVKKACNLFKKETMAQVFFCEFCKIFKNTFYRTPGATFSDQNHTTVLKKDSSTGVFREFARFPRIVISQNVCGQLLVKDFRILLFHCSSFQRFQVSYFQDTFQWYFLNLVQEFILHCFQ